MKNDLVARCTMCPSAQDSRCYVCTLLKPDLASGVPYPCRFVKAFSDGKRVYQVAQYQNTRRTLYKAQYRDGGQWKPYRTKMLPCRNSFDRAQTDLNLYAASKKWAVIWPMEVDG